MMRDAAQNFSTVVTAKLNREMDERECRQRNALSMTHPGFSLAAGTIGTVVETFGTGEAFLVEFNSSGATRNGQCDWMGVLYPTEIELSSTAEKG
jgi:hypothetical protein